MTKLQGTIDGPRPLPTKRFMTLMAARRYSHFVRGMRFILPLGAALALGLIVLWPGFQGRVGGVQFSYASVQSANSELRMLAPRLTGRDKQNRPYTITAKSAVPESRDANRIKLDDIDGDMTMSDGTWVNLTAPFGTYDKFLHHLDLVGPISVHTDQGMEMDAKSAAVDLSKGSITTDEPVAIQGPFGTLESDTAHLSDRGARTEFNGHVRGTLIVAKSGRK